MRQSNALLEPGRRQENVGLPLEPASVVRHYGRASKAMQIGADDLCNDSWVQRLRLITIAIS
jgi:hypothetical protein